MKKKIRNDNKNWMAVMIYDAPKFSTIYICSKLIGSRPSLAHCAQKMS